MKTVSSASRRAILPAAVLAGLVAAVFGFTVGFDFLQWDDVVNVTENPHLATGSAEGLARLWAAPYAGLYVPATYTWWWTARVLSRDLGAGEEPDPHVYHAGNVVLHAVCAWLAFLLLRRLLRSEAGALAGAALFAVHPLQAEVVCWVTGSKDLLAAALSLAALLLHLRFREHGGGRARGGAIALFALAVLAKPSAVAVPALAFLVDAVWMRRPWREAAVALVPWAVIAAALFLVTKAQQPDRVLVFDVPWALRPAIALDALAFYLAKVVAPFGLVPDYGRIPEKVLASGAAAWTWLAPAAAAGLVLRFRRDRRWTVPAAWFLLALAPVLGLIPFEYQNISTVADRYAYLALLGPALAAGAIVAARPRREVLAGAAALVLAAGFAANRQAAHWRDTEALFEHTLRLQPRSFSAHHNLGVEMAARGAHPEAIAHYDEVIRLAPWYFRAWANRGNAREKLGDPEAAAADLTEALRLSPTHVAARLNLVRVLESLGRDEEAGEQLALAARMRPDSPEALNSLGVRAYEAGDLETAERNLRRAVKLRPAYPEALNNLANCLVRQGRPNDALPLYREALRLAPDYHSAHLNLGKLLIRSTDRAGAVRHLERALELGGPNPELERRIRELKAAPPELPAPPPEPTVRVPPAGDQSR